MATVNRHGMLDCLNWGDPAKTTSVRGDVQDVEKLLVLRDALRANEPAPFDAACWMADAIDQTILAGGSLDERLGLRRKGKPSIRHTARITRRDALLRLLADRISIGKLSQLEIANAVIAMLSGHVPPPDSAAADAVAKLRAFKNMPGSSRQVMRIIFARSHE